MAIADGTALMKEIISTRYLSLYSVFRNGTKKSTLLFLVLLLSPCWILFITTGSLDSSSEASSGAIDSATAVEVRSLNRHQHTLPEYTTTAKFMSANHRIRESMVGDSDDTDYLGETQQGMGKEDISNTVEAASDTKTPDDSSAEIRSGNHRNGETATRIPFFGNPDEHSTREVASHLNHRLEEYQEDLVRVVQGLDLIINRLEEAAANAGTGHGDMPSEGMRHLAAKLRRKLEKTPPRWQVNTDVLSWLLRPVPFIAGLPAPSLAATPTPTAPCGKTPTYRVDPDPQIVKSQAYERHLGDTKEGESTYRVVERTRQTDEEYGAELCRGDDGVAPPISGVASEAFETGAAAQGEAIESAARLLVEGAQGSPEFDASVKERRAAPIVQGPAAAIADAIGGMARAGDGGERNGYGGVGSGGKEKAEGSSNRTGFHSYDETHQVFTHILRDWTSAGDSVRAAVYGPLFEALDEFVGGREDDHDNTAPSEKSNGNPEEDRSKERRHRRDRGEGTHDRLHPLKAGTTRKASVLVPGAGLGRLAVEIAARGYASVHANELSPTMLASCFWLMEALKGDAFRDEWSPRPMTPPSVRGEKDRAWSPPPAADCISDRDADVEGDFGDNGGNNAREHVRGKRSTWGTGSSNGVGADGEGRRERAGPQYFEFYPFLNDAAHNEVDGEARFRSVLVPDPEARTVLARASGRLSFQAGEFSATYGAPGGPFEGAFDAVVTSFFVDTAPNVVQYIATIRRTLRAGGVWINCGPLHWHNQSALALSLDEMLALIEGSGFRMHSVKRLPPCAYRVEDGGGSLRVDEFKPVFWVAYLERGERGKN